MWKPFPETLPDTAKPNPNARKSFAFVDCLDRDIWPIQVYIGSGKWACMGEKRWMLVTEIDGHIHWMEITDPSNTAEFIDKQTNYDEDDLSECELLWQGKPGGFVSK
jgi:hypothetical protein